MLLLKKYMYVCMKYISRSVVLTGLNKHKYLLVVSFRGDGAGALLQEKTMVSNQHLAHCLFLSLLDSIAEQAYLPNRPARKC